MSTARLPQYALANRSWPQHRIPAVDSWWHNWGYPVVVVVPTEDNGYARLVEPTDTEIATLASYQEFRLPRIYDTYSIEVARKEPFYMFGDVITVAFHKRQGGTWHHYFASWTMHGPTPFINDAKQYHDIVELLDYVEKHDSEKWLQWKADHPDVFVS